MLRSLLTLSVAFVASGGFLRADEPNPPEAVGAVVITEEAKPVPAGELPERGARLELVASDGFAFVEAGPQSKYWIGLGCELATDALKSQLGLTEKQALLVTMVAENSPAKTAGFQEHDVITMVKFGEETKPLDSVATLTNLVAKAETKPLVLSVIRTGKSQDITVTPAERPQPNQDVLFLNSGTFNVAVAPPATPANPERVQQLLRELQSAVSGQPQPTTIHFTGPVVTPPVPVPPPGVPHIVVMAKPELPDNVTITITKTGKEPVRIKYQTGENNSWGATEKEINTLPPEGRSALQAVLASLHQGAAHPFVSGPGPGVVSEWPVRHVYKTETVTGQGVNSNAGARGTITATVVAPAKSVPPEDAATRLQMLEKRLEHLQKLHQDLMTKQQETLRRELQSLRESLEKTEKK